MSDKRITQRMKESIPASQACCTSNICTHMSIWKQKLRYPAAVDTIDHSFFKVLPPPAAAILASFLRTIFFVDSRLSIADLCWMEDSAIATTSERGKAWSQ